MASRKASRKALAIEDVGASIERWQADTVVRKDHETGTGPIGSLFNSLVEVLGLMLVDLKTRPDMSQHYQSLEASSAALFFWGTDLDVSRGELDEVLQDSTQLRDTCLLVLVSIGQFIVSSFVRLLSTKDRQQEILDSTGIVPVLEQAMNILDQQDYPPRYPEQDEEALGRTLRMKIDTLLMLAPSLASPAEEDFDDEEPRVIDHSEEHLPEQAYINKVAQRFPLAASTVVSHLGKLNWERYNHMLHLQRNATQQEMETTVMEKARTIFHDSALGSSMPAQSEASQDTPAIPVKPQSVYAPSVVSSRAEASHKRLPPLPPQARSGEPFTCAICNKQVRYQRTKAWKKHVFGDILAYSCLFNECSVANIFFEDSDAMMSHLEQHHDLDVSISAVTCPLCLEYTSEDRSTLALHFARHMEEIALAIIPSGVDSDDESANETPSEAENTHVDSESENDSLYKEMMDGLANADATNLPENGVDRTTRRRRWREDKIRDSRTKKKRNPVATEPNSLEASRSLDSEAGSVQSARSELSLLEDSNGLEEEDEITRCICGHQEYPGLQYDIETGSPTPDDDVGGLFIQCDSCKVWQHGGCVGILDETTIPDEYFCQDCRKDLHEVRQNLQGQRYSRYIPIIDGRLAKMPTTAKNTGSRAWSAKDDDILIQARAQGLNWNQIATKHFPNKSPNACRKRHERLMEPESLASAAVPTDVRHWSTEEEHNLEINLARFGTDWQAIADRLGTKTLTEVENYYLHLVSSGRSDLEEVAERADAHLEIVQLRRENEEKDARLRQLEQAVMVLQQSHSPDSKQTVGEADMPKYADHPRSPNPEQSHRDEISIARLMQLRQENEEKDSRLRQLEEAVMALQQRRDDRPYKCLVGGCEKLQGFTYSGELLRHEREVHKMHGEEVSSPHIGTASQPPFGDIDAAVKDFDINTTEDFDPREGCSFDAFLGDSSVDDFGVARPDGKKGQVTNSKAGPSTSWTSAELQSLEEAIARFGTDWKAIADRMGTKSPTMIEDQYSQLLESGRTSLRELAKHADARLHLKNSSNESKEKEELLRLIENEISALRNSGILMVDDAEVMGNNADRLREKDFRLRELEKATRKYQEQLSSPSTNAPTADNEQKPPKHDGRVLHHRRDQNGVLWISFEYSRDGMKMEYTIRTDIDSAEVDELSEDFKAENCLFPLPYKARQANEDVRLPFETTYNTHGWALARLNPCLRGNLELLKRAVDCSQNTRSVPQPSTKVSDSQEPVTGLAPDSESRNFSNRMTTRKDGRRRSASDNLESRNPYNQGQAQNQSQLTNSMALESTNIDRPKIKIPPVIVQEHPPTSDLDQATDFAAYAEQQTEAMRAWDQGEEVVPARNDSGWDR